MLIGQTGTDPRTGEQFTRISAAIVVDAYGNQWYTNSPFIARLEVQPALF